LSIYFSSTISPGKPLIFTPSNLTIPECCDEEIDSLCAFMEANFSPAELAGKLNVESKILLCKELANVGILVLSK
jgi:hypothetical protein